MCVWCWGGGWGGLACGQVRVSFRNFTLGGGGGDKSPYIKSLYVGVSISIMDVSYCLFTVASVSFGSTLIMAVEGIDAQQEVCAELNIVEAIEVDIEIGLLVTGGLATGEICIMARCKGSRGFCPQKLTPFALSMPR